MKVSPGTGGRARHATKVTDHTDRTKDKNYTIVSTDTEKHLIKLSILI